MPAISRAMQVIIIAGPADTWDIAVADAARRELFTDPDEAFRYIRRRAAELVAEAQAAKKETAE